MTPDELREVAGAYLAPLLSARILPGLEPGAGRGGRVAYLEPSKIAINFDGNSEGRVVLYRVPGFVSEEKDLVESYLDAILSLHEATAPEFRADLFRYLPNHAIAAHLGGYRAMQIILRQLESWASRTYEGGAITSSIGVDPNAHPSGVYLADVFTHDFSAVLSNGFDTLLVCDASGSIAGAGQLAASELGLDYAPYRLGAIANWCTGNRTAFVLNRLGEILVFNNKQLLFAKRKGEWQYYAHEMYIRQLQPPQRRDLRIAIYQTCLDISFARTGGCLIVAKASEREHIADIVSEEDLLGGGSQSIKSKTIASMVGQSFEQLDRRLRQELLALDGATLLGHDGEVVAVGAIISVPSGSDGGGRRAAARKGSELGLGVKMSEDGQISVFKNGEYEFDV